MHAVISAGKPWDSSAAIDRAVNAQPERQVILALENPLMLWHVLHEGVLRHVVGSPETMRAQLDKLAREPAAALPPRESASLILKIRSELADV